MACVYRVLRTHNNPYDTMTARFVTFGARAPDYACAPEADRQCWHGVLFDQVSFAPYPVDFERAREAVEVHTALLRNQFPDPHSVMSLVVGQVPYEMTKDLFLFTMNVILGCSILEADAITRQGLPTGAFRVKVPTALVPDVTERVGQRLLFDRAGIWFATNQSQKMALQIYVMNLRPAAKRPRGYATLEASKREFRPAEEFFRDRRAARACIA